MSCWLSMNAVFKIDCGSEERYLQFKEELDVLSDLRRQEHEEMED